MGVFTVSLPKYLCYICHWSVWYLQQELIMAFKHQAYVSNAINHNIFFIGDGHLVSTYNINFWLILDNWKDDNWKYGHCLIVVPLSMAFTNYVFFEICLDWEHRLIFFIQWIKKSHGLGTTWINLSTLNYGSHGVT